MRNFPLVPKEQQAPRTADELSKLWSSNDGVHTFESKGGFKATKVENGQYVKWTTDSYPTPEEAIKNL
jgi:hypothetical protein